MTKKKPVQRGKKDPFDLLRRQVGLLTDKRAGEVNVAIDLVAVHFTHCHRLIRKQGMMLLRNQLIVPHGGLSDDDHDRALKAVNDGLHFTRHAKDRRLLMINWETVAYILRCPLRKMKLAIKLLECCEELIALKVQTSTDSIDELSRLSGVLLGGERL